MNCRTCAYPLWNLGTHVCPECGTPFSPADFEFLPCSVRFCCPHCDQSYYGTDPRGQLLPRSFTCVKCDAALTVEAMIVRPLREGEASTHSSISMPWFERERRGTVRAWFATIGPAMTRPEPLVDAVPEDASASGAVGFMAMNIAIFTIVSGIPMALFSGLLFNGILTQGGASRVEFAFVQAAGFAVTVVSLIVGAVIWAVVLHGCLRLMGGTTKPLLRTLHAVTYSSPAAVLMAVPCGCPGILGAIWWIISALRMTARAHRSDVAGGGGRVAAAGIAALIIALAPVIAAQAAMIIWSQNATVRMNVQAGGFGSAPIAAGQIGPALRAVADRSGAWPAHGLELWSDGMTAFEFAPLSSAPWTERAGSSLRFADLERDPDAAAALIENEAARLPATTIAHRVGDVIFTYHGIDPGSESSELWIALIPQNQALGEDWIAIQLNGSPLAIRATPLGIQSALEQQNRIRAAEGLAPLPLDLDRLTVDAPAVR